MGKAFHGITRRERPTLENPALSEDMGTKAAVPAAAYGRRRHVDIALQLPNAGTGATLAAVACCRAAAAGAGRSAARGCRAATIVRLASCFHGAGAPHMRRLCEDHEEGPAGAAEARRSPPTGSLVRRGARLLIDAISAIAPTQAGARSRTGGERPHGAVA
mmetsp:Transcript_31166/g.84541  ORF Transcript_31166/g.84541 Transcript_31166/m.84541 type:complete len:161 (+) Transcript_31166:418-900(+)